MKKQEMKQAIVERFSYRAKAVSYGDQGPGKKTLTLLATGRRGVLIGR